MLLQKTIELKAIITVGFSVPEAFSCDGPLKISIIHNTFSNGFLRNTACVKRKIRFRIKTNSLNYVKSWKLGRKKNIAIKVLSYTKVNNIIL